MRDYKALETVLKNEYGGRVSVAYIKPLHDEDFEAGYVVCVDNIIVANADIMIKNICEAIERYTEV